KVIENTSIVEKITPQGVEIVERGIDEKIKFYINHNDFTVTLDEFSLDPFECKIIKCESTNNFVYLSSPDY
ncbi:hypothetical protein, partial [uncultured Fusobacterium sp.]